MFDVLYSPNLDPARVTRRIIFNPNYGGAPCEVEGTCTVAIRSRGIKPKTRQAIEDSIMQEGFRNPILVYSTESGVHLSFGGGRLTAAKNLGIRMPAIVVDYAGNFYGCDPVTPSNWTAYFKDIPSVFAWTPSGIMTHYGLERGRGDWYDPAGVAWTDNLDDIEFLIEESPWLPTTN